MNIETLDYNKLLLLADSSSFYEVIDSKEKVELYVNKLHQMYCKENNMKRTKVEFSNELKDNVYGCYDYKSHKIYINSKFLEIFNKCKETNNRYYPYMLLMTIVHESRHLWQHLNIKKMFDKNTSDREKVTLYSIHKKMYEVKEAIKETRGVKIKEIMNIKDFLGSVKSIFVAQELELEYGNSPCELDSEEEVIKAFKYIYETTLSEDSLVILLNYTESIRNNSDKGLWFIGHEYYEDKESPYDKRAFEVIKSVYMNYLKESLEHHKKGEHFYQQEDHLISLYPNLNEIILKIRENGYQIPKMNSEDSKVLNIFSSNNQKLLTN